MNKINAYIGFAIKSRSVVYGTDNILTSKGCKLIVVSNKLSINALQKLQSKNIQIITLSENDYAQLNLKGLAVGITDKSLAEAIQKHFIAQ